MNGLYVTAVGVFAGHLIEQVDHHASLDCADPVGAFFVYWLIHRAQNRLHYFNFIIGIKLDYQYTAAVEELQYRTSLYRVLTGFICNLPGTCVSILPAEDFGLRSEKR